MYVLLRITAGLKEDPQRTLHALTRRLPLHPLHCILLRGGISGSRSRFWRAVESATACASRTYSLQVEPISPPRTRIRTAPDARRCLRVSGHASAKCFICEVFVARVVCVCARRISGGGVFGLHHFYLGNHRQPPPRAQRALQSCDGREEAAFLARTRAGARAPAFVLVRARARLCMFVRACALVLLCFCACVSVCVRVRAYGCARAPA